MVYLTMLLVAQTIHFQMVEWSENNELENIQTEVVWPHLRNHPSMCMEGVGKPLKPETG
jgi:hypothetical protein